MSGLIAAAFGAGIGWTAVNSFYDIREGRSAQGLIGAVVALFLLAGGIANVVQS